MEPTSETTAAIASAQPSAPPEPEPEPENQNRKRKIAETVGPLEELETQNDDAIVELALQERGEDLAKLRASLSDIIESSEGARYRAQAVRNEVHHYPWGPAISECIDFQQLGTQQTSLMSAVAHASLTKAEKREFLKNILDDAQHTKERLRVAIHDQQGLINEFLEDHKVLKSYMDTVENLKAEADLISKELTK
jgi:hypothetical protein